MDKRYFGWLTPQLRLFWMELFQPFRRKSLTQKDTELVDDVFRWRVVADRRRMLELIGEWSIHCSLHDSHGTSC